MTTSVGSAAFTRSTISDLFSAQGRRASVIMCIAVVVLAAVYLAPLMLKGWVPFDEGTLAQSAHRILIGELPHRDFDEVYTGGLSFAHAAVFRVLGENLVSLRLVFFGAILLTVPACYYIASRFASPVVAAGVTMAAFLSSFPSYPAAMPSWYNLIFALFGCAALLRYLEAGSRWWVFAAGLCGGLSILAKITGVYFVAGSVLFLIVHAHATPWPNEHRRESLGAIAAIPPFIAVAVLAIAPFLIMRGRLRLDEAVVLGFPIFAVSMGVALEMRRAHERGDSGRSPAVLAWTALPFAIGLLIPLLCFVVPYAQSGALRSLYDGVFVLPQKRLAWAAEDGPPVISLLLGVPPLYLITSARFSKSALRWRDIGLVLLLEVLLVGWSTHSLKVTASLWTSIRMAGPLVVVVGAFVLSVPHSDSETLRLRRGQLWLLLSTAAWCALIQFPNSSYQYFLYVLPLFVLSAAALAAFRGTLSRNVGLATLSAFIVLSLFLRPVFIAGGGGAGVVLGGESAAKMDLARGGLIVRRSERDRYVQLAATIQEHSQSRFIYVSPDAPEVYFLAGRENPTRTLFDFFDNPKDRTNHVLSAVRDHGVDVVVVNRTPRFSGEMPLALRDSLKAHFPHAASVGQFEVRWRIAQEQ